MSMGSNSTGLPGLGTPVFDAPRNILWGQDARRNIVFSPNTVIAKESRDAGNTANTTVLRAGLVLGVVTASGKWKEYDPTDTDGTQWSRGILLQEVNVSPSGINQDSQAAIAIGGLATATDLIGLDGTARRLLSGFFGFDDDLPLTGPRGELREITKITDYTVVAADNFTRFVLTTATGTFTLPAIGKGYLFEFLCRVDADMVIASAEGDNIVAIDNDTADSLTFGTSSEKIGGYVRLRSNAAGDRWIFENLTNCTLTVGDS